MVRILNRWSYGNDCGGGGAAMADVELDADADSAVQAFDPSRAVRLLAAGVGGGGGRREEEGTAGNPTFQFMCIIRS